MDDPDLAGHERMAAAVTLLAAELADVAPRLLAGQVDQAERHQLAGKLIEIARDLRRL